MTDPTPAPGQVTLVGAGPGDPKLLTLRGAECLARADVVLYDYLANPRLLELAPESAERICLGQHGRTRIWTQAEINRALVEFAQQGRRVVRLKGGDPAVFARTTEEVETLVEAGIPFEIVPGITAALAAGSYAGIPITQRDLASAVAFITGHENDDKAEPALDYTSLARFPGTLVFYMGVTTARHWVPELIRAGKDPRTPAAIVRRCSQPDQQVWRGTLGQIPELLDQPPRWRPPAIMIVGPVAHSDPRWSWFDRRPLFGQRILVTRPGDQADKLADPLRELGADVQLQPAIRITAPTDWTVIDGFLERLAEFDWLVFSSANGVRSFLTRLLATGRDLRTLGGIRLAAIGPGTSDELHRYHLKADLVPAEFRAEALAAALSTTYAGQRFLLVRASRGREVLAETLRSAGCLVEQVVAYQSTDVDAPNPEVLDQLAAGDFDWITVTSSAIATSLARLFGDHLRRAKLVSISPITSNTLRTLGYEPTVEATEYTMAGVVAAIRRVMGQHPLGDRNGVP